MGFCARAAGGPRQRAQRAATAPAQPSQQRCPRWAVCPRFPAPDLFSGGASRRLQGWGGVGPANQEVTNRTTSARSGNWSPVGRFEPTHRDLIDDRGPSPRWQPKVWCPKVCTTAYIPGTTLRASSSLNAAFSASQEVLHWGASQTPLTHCSFLVDVLEFECLLTLLGSCCQTASGNCCRRQFSRARREWCGAGGCSAGGDELPCGAWLAGGCRTAERA